MTIKSGTRLGPYEIVAPIGAGGMGEVYRALDTRLDRAVAVKILPSELAADAQFRIRFEREAKTISHLSHPNICTLYDVGENYLVMELLEGESLADRLAKGPLPVSEVLKIGTQIGEALGKAHRQGVIHRDLKPGNIMLTKSGAKLLDFGLAKNSPVGPLPDTATVQKPLTAEGTVIGTFQYMAPEQLAGEEPDARTDIFALGAVLYEMATGKRAFEGKSRTSLIAAIVSGEPKPLRDLQPLTPPAFEHLVAKCMAKDPEERWQNAQDVAEELKWIREGTNEKPASPRRLQRITVAAAFLAGLAITALAFIALRNRLMPPRPTTRLTIAIPASLPLAAYGATNLAISPSGRWVALVGDRDGVTQLYLRNLGSLDAIAVPGAERAVSPVFSPDSRWLAFQAGRFLQKVSVDGGAPQNICEAAELRGASWRSHLIAFAVGTSGIWTVPDVGGQPKLVVHQNELGGEDFLAWPELLPGNEAVLFCAFHATRSEIAAFSFRTGKRTPLISDGSRPRFVDGYLIFSRGSSVFAVRFDPKALRTIGSPVAVLDSVYTIAPYNLTLSAVGDDGTLVYASGGIAEPRRMLVWVEPNGHVTPIGLPQEPYEEPRLSPDGTHVAVASRSIENADIWNADLTRNTLTRVTFDPGEDETAVWSRDGARIAFAASRTGSPRSIYWRRADGAGGEEMLLASPPLGGHEHMSDFSPDGQWMAYTNFDPSFAGDIWVMSMLSGKVRPFVRTPFNERAPRFSTDGKFIAYTSNESGRDEVYVQSFPSATGKWQVSNDGGSEVVWAHNGKELFYRNGDKMMAVDVETGSRFNAATPRVLFTGSFLPTRRGEAGYDVTADGKKFLMLQRDQSGPAPLVVVALDWFTELDQRMRAAEAQ